MLRYLRIFLFSLLIISGVNCAYGQFELNAGIGFQHERSAFDKTIAAPSLGIAHRKEYLRFSIDVSLLRFSNSIVSSGASIASGHTTYYRYSQEVKHDFVSLRYGISGAPINKPKIICQIGLFVNSSLPINDTYSLVTINENSSTYTEIGEMLEMNSIHYLSGFLCFRYNINKSLATQLECTYGQTDKYKSTETRGYWEYSYYSNNEANGISILTCALKLIHTITPRRSITNSSPIDED